MADMSIFIESIISIFHHHTLKNKKLQKPEQLGAFGVKFGASDGT